MMPWILKKIVAFVSASMIFWLMLAVIGIIAYADAKRFKMTEGEEK